MKGQEDVITFREIDVYKDSAAADKYDIQATPTVIILDADGKQVYSYAGIPEEDELRKAIDEATSP